MLLSSNSLEVVFLSSLNVLITAVLNFLYSKSNILLGTGIVTIDRYFSLYGQSFPAPLHTLQFFVKN